jgi:HD-like signal output (HDOD) protein
MAASLMLVSENSREMQVLKLAFEQKNIQVLCCTPEYKNYVKILQYMPDTIFLELPRIAHLQLHFAEMVKTHKKIRHIPIVGYGDKIDDAVRKGLVEKGIFYYLSRPLKFSIILDVVKKNLKQFHKDIEVKEQPHSDKEKDIELLLAKETPAMKKIEILTTSIAKLVAFPFTVAKVLQLTENEKSAAGDLAKVIQADPVISAQLLKIANSVLFASLNRRIGSVKDAIIRVGFKETRRLVMSMSVMKMFGTVNKNIGLDRTAFWFHSLVCGIISERLAKLMATVNTEEAFLSGILHDLGILLLDDFFPTVFSRALEYTTNKNSQFVQCEKALLGVTHNDMVAELFTKWKLPDSVTEGVLGQYQFQSFENNLDSPGKKIALCVGMSDILAKTAGFGRECDRYISPIANWVFESVKMPAGFSAIFFEDIANQIKLYREFLKIDNKDIAFDGREKTAQEKATIAIINQARDIFIPPHIYFQNEGYAATLVTGDSLNTATSAIQKVLIWADATVSIEAISAIVKTVNKTQQTPNSPACTPVIVCVEESAAVLSHKNDFGNVLFLNKSFDLRQLDVQDLEAMQKSQTPKAQKVTAAEINQEYALP